MAINKRKVVDAARKYVQKGARAKAFKEYSRLLAADPHDTKLLLEVGDVYRRWGEVEEAITHYTKVATIYRTEGYDARAIAVLKQIIALDPMRHTVRVALAELYQHIGLASEAVGALQQVADVYASEGRQRESLNLLRKMAAVDPSNVRGRIKVAELLEKAGHNSESVEEYREAAREFARQDDAQGVVEMHERVLALAPKHVPTLVALARELTGLGEPGRAEPYALRALGEEIKAEHYELACEIYAAMGEEEKLADMARDLAALYRERGDEERAREVAQRAPMGAELDKGDLAGDAEMDVVGIDQPLPGAAESAAPESKLDSAQAAIEQADVHLGYGQFDEAIACLEDLLKRAPGDLQVLVKLGEAKAGSGDRSAAAECWKRAESLAREAGDLAAAGALSQRVEALSASESEGEAAVEFGDGFEIEIDPEAGDDFDVELQGQGAGDAFAFDEGEAHSREEAGAELAGDSDSLELGGAGVAREQVLGELDPAPQGAYDPARINEDIEEAEFYLQQSMVAEAKAVYRRLLEGVPGHSGAVAKLAEIEAAERGAPEGQGTEIDFDLGTDSEADLETDFETELDLEFDMGTQLKAAGLTEEPGPGPVPEEGGSDTEAEDEFEIEIEIDDGPSAEYAAEVDSEAAVGEIGEVAPAPGTDAASVEAGVAELFADFKQGVSETLDKGDYQTRFDLGIAYREMELLEDAIAEFRYCLEAPDWRLQSLQMIGLSSLDLGRAADAVSHFEQALSAPDLTDAQKSGLYFDFARAQAALGDTDPAHDSFARVRAIDPEFVGLDEQIAALPPRTPGSEPAVEEYESFDDLLAEFRDDDPA